MSKKAAKSKTTKTTKTTKTAEKAADTKAAEKAADTKADIKPSVKSSDDYRDITVSRMTFVLDCDIYPATENTKKFYRTQLEELWENAPEEERKRVYNKICETSHKTRGAPPRAFIEEMRWIVGGLCREAGIMWIREFYACAQKLRNLEISEKINATASIRI